MNEYYYIYKSGDKEITLTGIGDDPTKCAIVWSSSKNATEDLKKVIDTITVMSPVYGITNIIIDNTNIYTQVLRLGILIREGYRCTSYDVPSLKPVKED